MDYSKKKTLNSTFMLYILSFAKIIFPLITLPYLTRVLSTDCYGVVSYVKSYIVYAQLIVDFGFILSSVKDIVNTNGDLDEIGIISGQTFLSKLILSLGALIITIIMSLCLPILREYFLFTILSYFVVFLSCFLADFLFRGIEKMHYITIVFVIMKTISTALTFVLVKCDDDVLWIPILDIISSLIAIGITIYFVVHKLKIKIRIESFVRSIIMLKESFFYFISNMATTAFGALNTLLIGIFISDLTEVAYWSVCTTIVAAIQALYSPIINGIYPYMVKNHDLSYIHKVLFIIMPILFICALIGYNFSKLVLLIVGGEEYVDAYWLLRSFIPLLIISFPSMLYGWPTLGAINKIRETTYTTIFAAVIQVLGLVVLIAFDAFTLINISIIRFISELCLLVTRVYLTYRNKKLFAKVE